MNVGTLFFLCCSWPRVKSSPPPKKMQTNIIKIQCIVLFVIPTVDCHKSLPDGYTLCAHCAAYKECKICHRKLRSARFFGSSDVCNACNRKRVTRIQSGGNPTSSSSNVDAVLSRQSININQQQPDSVLNTVRNNLQTISEHLRNELKNKK